MLDAVLKQNRETLGSASDALSTYHLSMQFGGIKAVSDLDLEVPAGSICSVIGPNGAGKTTVFNAVTGIYAPTSGKILFGGHELRRPFDGSEPSELRIRHDPPRIVRSSADLKRPMAAEWRCPSSSGRQPLLRGPSKPASDRNGGAGTRSTGRCAEVVGLRRNRKGSS